MLEFCNDQPGRFVAIFIISPMLLYKGYNYNDIYLILLAIILFFWDTYWIVTSKPNKKISDQIRNVFN